MNKTILNIFGESKSCLINYIRSSASVLLPNYLLQLLISTKAY